MKNESPFSNVQKMIVITCMILVIFFQFVDLTHLGYIKDVNMITNTITRFSAGTLLVLVLIRFGRRDLLSFSNVKKSLVLMIPALLIAMNNFPISAYFNGRTNLTEPIYRVILFFIECLSVGFFEEVLFRGILLIVLVEKLEHVKGGTLISILISSLIFGLLHLVNLFDGATLGSALLQVGYSFLMGILWATLYLKTGNLWLVMILHAVYNFFGQVMFYLGTVENRYDNLTLFITWIFAVLSGIYVTILLRNDRIILHRGVSEEREV
ncbi:MAG: CPBP family intramembrane glutamic endopeptidase [bacterium]